MTVDVPATPLTTQLTSQLPHQLPSLFVSTTSPFARLVMIVAYLEGIDLALHFVNAWENPEALTQVNPFSQIPTLLNPDGTVISETPLIINYLAPQVFLQDKSEQMPKIAQAITIINQAVKAFSIQRFAPEDSVPHPFIERASRCLQVALPKLPTLDAHSPQWGDIFLVCALAYVQLRLPDIYATAVSMDNQHATEQMMSCDFMQKTLIPALEKSPQRISDL